MPNFNLGLTGRRSANPTFIFPFLNSRRTLFLSSDSPYTTEPSMYEDSLFTCSLGVLVLRPVHLGRGKRDLLGHWYILDDEHVIP